MSDNRQAITSQHNNRLYMTEDLAAVLSKVGGVATVEAASRLIEKTGSVSELITTPFSVMRAQLGEKGALFSRLLFSISSRRVTDSFILGASYEDEKIADAFVAAMLGYSHEVAFMLSIDSDGRAIAFDYVCEGSVNAFSVVPRRIVEKALDRQAARVIIGHNHPTGAPDPSDEDVGSTVKLAGVLTAAGIRLDGHVIVSGLTASILKVDRNNCNSVSIIRFDK